MIDLHFLFFILRRSIVPAMCWFANWFGGFSQAAAPLVVTALWQGAIVACGLAVCLRLARRASAAHRFLIWAAGFVALVCLPFLPVLMRAAGSGLSAGYGVGAGSSSGPLLRVDLRWSLALGGLWIAASAVRTIALANQMVRLRRLWKSARPVEGGEFVVSHVSEDSKKQVLRLSFASLRMTGVRGIFAVASDWKVGSWGQRRAQVCTTKALDKPAVIGFFAPRILIPEWLYARLTREELEHVILHESEHLRRRDDWMNMAQKICLVVFPLNPALAWMDKRLASEREMACDEGVVRATKAPRAYAACLASLAERGLKRRTEALALGAWQRRPELVERVHRILRRTPGLSPVATMALVGAMTSGLIFGSIEFARCPQLVAFVPTQQFASRQIPVSAVGDARFVDASYGVNRRNGGAFATDVVARMPEAGRGVSISKAHGKDASRARLMKAELPNAPMARQEQIVQPQFILLTAWEQVEGPGRWTANREAGLRRDYDPEPTADEEYLPESNEGGRGVMTRLILKVYPVGVDSANPDLNSPNPFLPTDRPAMIPVRDGWFVFQL